MKTLRELGIEPSDDLVDCMEYESNTPRETALDLTPINAVEKEINWEFDNPNTFDWFNGVLRRYGCRIVFGDENETS